MQTMNTEMMGSTGSEFIKSEPSITAKETRGGGQSEFISQLFLRQIRNLTRFDTVYVDEDVDGSGAISAVLAGEHVLGRSLAQSRSAR